MQKNVQLNKTAHREWSTWVSAALTAATTGYVTYMPELRDSLPPETYVKIVIGVGGFITVLRFIKQGISNE